MTEAVPNPRHPFTWREVPVVSFIFVGFMGYAILAVLFAAKVLQMPRLAEIGPLAVMMVGLVLVGRLRDHVRNPSVTLRLMALTGYLIVAVVSWSGVLHA